MLMMTFCVLASSWGQDQLGGPNPCREHPQVRGRFAFYVNEVKEIEKAVSLLNYQIVGTFHSHPYYIAEPARNDLTGSEDGELMLIIDCLNN